MTKLPETISKRFNILTGKEVPLGCVDEMYPRCSGRTTSLALAAIAKAMTTGFPAFVSDHADYPNAHSITGARVMATTIECLINKLGFIGFKVKVVEAPGGIHGAEVWFDLHQEVFYDLRK